jgi:hypothetical protein
LHKPAFTWTINNLIVSTPFDTLGRTGTLNEFFGSGIQRGACQLGGGTCEVLTAEDCATQGGSYDGNGTVCAGTANIAGDCNQDGTLDLSDVVCLLGHLFQGNPENLPCTSTAANLTLMDCNQDGGADLSDAIYKLAFLFQGGPPPEQGGSCIEIADCPQNQGCP